MKKILLVMYRKVFAEALASKLQNNAEFCVMVESQYKNAPISADIFAPDVILLEIPESGSPPLEECLALCEELRRENPASRILLLTPEGNKTACELTIRAVQEKRVDDFVYYDTSFRYLVSKLEAL